MAETSFTPMLGERIWVHGGETGLPAGLHLAGLMEAWRLPDGTLRLIGLPPDIEARYYPSLSLPDELPVEPENTLPSEPLTYEPIPEADASPPADDTAQESLSEE